MKEIPQSRIESLTQTSVINSIPLPALLEFYKRQLNDPAFVPLFGDNIEEHCSYIDMSLGTFISEFMSTKMDKYEIFVLSSSYPRFSKKGELYNNHIVLARLVGDNSGSLKFMNIRNNEGIGIVQRLEPKTTAIISVNVKTDENNRIEASTRQSSTISLCDIPWVGTTPQEKSALYKRAIRQTTIIEASKNISGKVGDYPDPFDLRIIEAVISRRFVDDRIDPQTKQVIGRYAILSLSDTSVSTNPDFMRDRKEADPKDPTKTITIYGGFSASVDPEDVEDIGQNSSVMLIGHITSGKNMKAINVIPIIRIPPKKIADRVAKPVDTASPAPLNPSAIIVNAPPVVNIQPVVQASPTVQAPPVVNTQPIVQAVAPPVKSAQTPSVSNSVVSTPPVFTTPPIEQTPPAPNNNKQWFEAISL